MRLLNGNEFCFAAGAGDELTPTAFADATEVLWEFSTKIYELKFGPFDVVFWNRYVDDVVRLTMVCRRKLPEYKLNPLSPTPILEKALSRRRMDPTKKRCPHHGALLASMPCSRTRDGRACVTCPQHGLTWNSTTGAMVKHAELER